VVVAANQGESLTGYHTPAGKAYENICRRIMGEDVPLACYPRRKSFFFRVADYLIHR
jgi:septum site-determining protein MinD